MKHDKIELSKIYNIKGGELYTYAMDFPFDGKGQWSRPALVIVPGGAYEFVSRRECEPVALDFLSRGFQVFALNYLVAPARYPEQLLELACAVDYIKKNAEAYNVNPSYVFALGFSAGGHLTCNLAVNNGAVKKYYGDSLDCTLTASGLSYPVISPEYGYTYTHEKLLGSLDNKDLILETSLDRQVNKNTCPCFIWTTFKDSLVPPLNSLKYAEALQRLNIQYELHIYPEGEHGESNCSPEINSDPLRCINKNAGWVNDCERFFRLFF